MLLGFVPQPNLQARYLLLITYYLLLITYYLIELGIESDARIFGDATNYGDRGSDRDCLYTGSQKTT
jgi:hypothetical protein